MKRATRPGPPWIDLLIDKQQSNGNWPIYNPDQENDGSGSQLGRVDVCAMALQALAPYYLDAGEFNRLGTAHSHEDLQSAVKKALDFLSTSQNSTGGYGSSESSAQVIVALAALKKDAGSFAQGQHQRSGGPAGLPEDGWRIQPHL